MSQASHDSSRWCVGSDSNAALSNPESPERAMTMQTGVTQSFRQRTAKSVSATDVKTEFCNVEIADFNYVSRVFQFLTKKLGIPEGKELFATEASKTNIMMWGWFMSSTMKEAIHLGLNHEENMEILKCRNFENVGNLFTLTENLVAENSAEILNVSTIDCRSSCWTESALAHDQVKKCSKAKVRVYSDLGE